LKFLQRACSTVSTPILGLGGIRPESIASVLDAGAAGIAAISLFQNSSDLNRLRDVGYIKTATDCTDCKNIKIREIRG
jgi:thiamine monophosphate synthase